MKYEFGDCTKRLSLWRRASAAAEGLRRSTARSLFRKRKEVSRSPARMHARPLTHATPRHAGPPTAVKYYLVLYNVLSTLGWAYVLVRTLAVVLDLDRSARRAGWPLVARAAGAYAEVGAATAFVQSFAALEVLHVLLGLVRSPLVTTLIQVGSRLYLVWGITYLFPKVCLTYSHNHPRHV